MKITKLEKDKYRVVYDHTIRMAGNGKPYQVQKDINVSKMYKIQEKLAKHIYNLEELDTMKAVILALMEKIKELEGEKNELT